MPWAAVGSAECCVPTMIPGPKPVMAELGLTPTSPVIEVRPVLVTVEPARTTKLEADLRATGGWLQPGVGIGAGGVPGPGGASRSGWVRDSTDRSPWLERSPPSGTLVPRHVAATLRAYLFAGVPTTPGVIKLLQVSVRPGRR
jgi:hypothetical protein